MFARRSAAMTAVTGRGGRKSLGKVGMHMLVCVKATWVVGVRARLH